MRKDQQGTLIPEMFFSYLAQPLNISTSSLQFSSGPAKNG
jgi:hypothetical protein